MSLMTTAAATHEHPCNKAVAHCNPLAGHRTATAPACDHANTWKEGHTERKHLLCQVRGCFLALCQAKSRIRWGAPDRGRNKEEADESSHQCPTPPQRRHSLFTVPPLGA